MLHFIVEPGQALFESGPEDSLAYGFKTQTIKACRSIGPDAKEALPGLLHAMKKELKPWRALMSFPTPLYIWATDSVTKTSLTLLIVNDILTYPAVNLLIAVCFGWRFLLSVRLRERGEKVFHWFLLLPALYYAGYLVHNVFTKVNSSFELLHNYKIFISLASAGLIPWLISRIIPGRRAPLNPDSAEG